MCYLCKYKQRQYLHYYDAHVVWTAIASVYTRSVLLLFQFFFPQLPQFATDGRSTADICHEEHSSSCVRSDRLR